MVDVVLLVHQLNYIVSIFIGFNMGTRGLKEEPRIFFRDVSAYLFCMRGIISETAPS
jgi:hypothetical protein